MVDLLAFLPPFRAAELLRKDTIMKRFFGRRMLMGFFGLTTMLALVGWSSGRGGACSRGEYNPERMKSMATHFVDEALDDLDATEAQRTALHGIKDDLLKEAQGMREKKKAMRQELVTLWDSPNPNPEEVHARIDARIEELRVLAHKAADAGLEVHQTLTPEQRAQVSQRIKSRMEKEK